MNCKNELLKNYFAEDTTRTYSVSLFFDEKSTVELSNFILQVAQITKNDYVVRNKIPPHITIGMFKATKNQEGQLLQVIQKINSDFQPIFEKKENVLCFEKLGTLKNKIAFLSFATNQSIVFTLNQKLHNSLMPDFPAACNNMYLPQVFFPIAQSPQGFQKLNLHFYKTLKIKTK